MDEDTADDGSISQMLYADSILTDVAGISTFPENGSSSLQKSHPNILKKRELPSKGPIQNLPFSPSRFLNCSADVTSTKPTISQEDTFCIGPTEDSGIEISTCDVDGIFSNPITSTPIAKRKREVSVGNSFELDSRLCESYFPSDAESLLEEKKILNHTPERVTFRTPLIRRFLNESGPRTPTPFKFDGNSFRISVGEGKRTIVVESSNKNSSRKIQKLEGSSPSIHEWSGRRKARKALNLDSTYQDMSENMLHPLKKPESLKPFLYRTQLKGSGISSWRNGSFYSKHLTGSLSKNSFLTSPFQECKHTETIWPSSCNNPQTSSSKSTLITSPKSSNVTDIAYSLQMNEKLVHIACGHSEDQKFMTIAAKRYLRSLQNNQATSASKKFPRSGKLSHHPLHGV